MERIRKALERQPPRRILVVRLSALGDVLHCLPALTALRMTFPEARIGWVTESLSASLLEGHPDLERVIRFPRKEIARDLPRVRTGVAAFERAEQFVSELRLHAYDLLLEFQGNLRSAAIAALARAQIRVGHHRRETKEFPWLVRASRPRTPAGEVHQVEKNLFLIRALGYRGSVTAGRLPAYTAEVCRIGAALDLGRGAPTILHPFVSAFGRFKEWPEERFAQLARGLAERGHRVLLTAALEDRPRRDRILALAGDAALAAPETASVRELAALLRLARLVVAADTGPLHIAAAAGVPVVGLFGPKDPKRYGPFGDGTAVLRGIVPCSPCRLRRCDHAICMQAIAVSDVLAACEATVGVPIPAAGG